MSNGLTFELSNILLQIFRIDAKWLENRVYKIYENRLRIELTGYRKANFHFGISSTVGQTVGLTVRL